MNKIYSALLFVLATSLPAFAQNTFPVRFGHGTEYFPENFVNARQIAPHPSEVVEGVYIRYIQLEKIMKARERQAFEATGARVIGYVQFGTYLVMLPENFDFSDIAAFSLRSIMPVKPEWKMARSLREPPYGDWAIHGDYIDINLQLYPMLSIAEGAALCRKNQLDVLKEGNQNGFIQVRVHQDQIAALAALPFVQYLELVPAPGQKEGTRGRSLHRANLVASEAPLGKKYDGTDVNVLVRDDGKLGPHIDLKGRLYNYAEGAANGGSHGDGVVGIVGGAGNLDPSKKGMAPGAALYSVDYINDFQDLTLPLHQTKGVTITNSSYGDGCNTGYTLTAQTVDQQLFENPTLMHVFSAGNSNETNCGYGAGIFWGNITGGHKMSKNSIATANVFSDATLEISSSRGPAYDGRLKPDISANGEDQESLSPNNGYQTFSGTSAASPGIAGCLAQLTHAYRMLNTSPDAPAALLKATILNTANDLGNVGPDFKFGWGHINTWRALQLLEQHQWLEGSVDQSENPVHTIQIPDGVKAAKIMLYWAEPPSLENNAKALLNDLDLSVEDGNGVSTLPWKLDPTPNATILNTPAGRGRDSLNNVEQVLIGDPAAGAYTIHVSGTEVPLGPQRYYLVWEFIKDEIKVTYPGGGEGFVPGEVERIHWDAHGNTGTFSLRYSTDGGNSFTQIASVGGNIRIYDWVVPNTVTGKLHLLVQRGGVSDTSDLAASIVQVPENLEVLKVCPDAITLGWNEVSDTLSYEGYLLGNKYMEIKGISDTNFVTMPIQSGADRQWLSVRTVHADGTTGRRAVAINWPGGLLNCPQNFDLGLGGIIAPAGNATVSCDASDIQIRIQVKNEGLNPSINATAFYQIDNKPPISEPLPNIPVSGVLDYTFQTPLVLNFNGTISLKTWVVFPNDAVDYNDTLEAIYVVVSGGINQFFTEKFEATGSLPVGWASVNPDGRLGWEPSDSLEFEVVGPDDVFGHSLHVNFFSYGPNEEGQEDFLYMIPLDLAGLTDPTLRFKVAHAQYNSNFSDSLRVEVFSNCDLAATPVTVWGKSDPELATTPNQTAYYIVSSASEWRDEAVSLSAFIGQKILVRFVSVNGYGNSLYLDDIGLAGVDAPMAEFAAPDSICRLDTVIFQAAPSSIGPSYVWFFGNGAIPDAATGIGPHTVYFPTAGNHNVQLVVNNALGSDTLSRTISVSPLATANFTVQQNGLTFSFTNTSTNANSYFWDFGDGVTSTEANPTHTYANTGNYVVNLFATNDCRTHLKSLTVTGLSRLNDLEEKMDLQILPNPTAGDFAVEMHSRFSGKVQFKLFDPKGRQVKSKAMTVKAGVSRVSFENLDLPKGVYQLNIQAENRQGTYNIVVQ